MHNLDESVLPVFQDIYTTEDLYSFYKEIDQCNTLLFKNGYSVGQAFQESFNTGKVEKLYTYLKNKNITLENPAHIQEALTGLKKIGPDFPVVTLKLGYDPTSHHLETFSAWFETNLNTKVILEILVERSLLGGAYITYHGLFKDYSLKSKLQKTSLTHDFPTKNKSSNL